MEIELILSHGDPLERAMFSDPYFSRAFDGYAVVWRNHVLPQRREDGYASPPWREFAQRNYSAVVRCWNAGRCRDRIAAAGSRAVNAVDVLDLHGELAGFFALTRSAIENLHGAFVDRQLARKEDWSILDEFGSAPPNIGWLRHVRNDLVHNRVIPIDHRQSPVTIDCSLIPTDKSTQNTAWHDGKGVRKPLAQFVDDVWSAFTKQMNVVWSKLDRSLNGTASGCGTGVGHGPGVGSGSGVERPTSGSPGSGVGTIT